MISFTKKISYMISLKNYDIIYDIITISKKNYDIIYDIIMYIGDMAYDILYKKSMISYMISPCCPISYMIS